MLGYVSFLSVDPVMGAKMCLAHGLKKLKLINKGFSFSKVEIINVEFFIFLTKDINIYI